jgi:hypothetical protein
MKDKIQEIKEEIKREIKNMKDEQDRSFFAYVLKLYQAENKKIIHYKMLACYVRLRKNFMNSTKKM